MLTVVVPCRDEEGNVPRLESELLTELAALERPYEVLAVDDGSRDGTADALETLSRHNPQIRVLLHPESRGMGAALRTAFAAADPSGWTVTLDADLTFHPRHIKALLARQRETGADWVAGSPFLTPEGLREVSWNRRQPTRAINLVYRFLFNRDVTSYSPIFRLYRTSLLKNLPLASRGFEINAEIAVRLLRRGAKAAEVAVPLTVRRSGVSKLRPFRELALHGRLILRLASGG